MAMLISKVLHLIISSKLTVFKETCQNQCSLQNGQCTYNIQLSHVENGCSRITEEGESTKTGQVQNDNARVQQDLAVVKTDHENRLRELEASVQKILRSAVSAPPAQMTLSMGEGINLRPQRNRTENSLLTRLHDEFTKIRSQLSKKSIELAETYRKLNESALLLEEAQDDLFATSEQLLNAEQKAATFEQEGYILKNKLKHARSRYIVAEENFNISETKRISLENQLYTVVRSEANLKEELETYKYRFNETLTNLHNLKREHSLLNDTYLQTKKNLRKTEMELMDCYTGYYMYIESSSKLRGKKARMFSPVYRGINHQCVEFYYHMYGRNIGTLKVYTKIIFEGITELGYLGDIAVDDIRITDGACRREGKVSTIRVTAGNNTSTTSKARRKLKRYRKLLTQMRNNPQTQNQIKNDTLV
ncbi:hypothetical protein KUTeg_004741 [Tegillarca granosa]|uniref:MAM domain-containing protein n=1 Tax=Tegillarca granosa TaxID=220873 RepID=A0ABQ9FHP8_TEGGR|nr:hypothetical protein KUTeg_004741 [Tegillarca granosa]